MDVTHTTLLNDKVLRLFPVTKDGIEILTDKLSKVPQVPDMCVIIKDNIIGKTIKDVPNFDINYYVKTFNDELDSWLNGVSEEDEGDE